MKLCFLIGCAGILAAGQSPGAEDKGYATAPGRTINGVALDRSINDLGGRSTVMADYIGCYRGTEITEVYGLPGATLWMERDSTITNMPDWFVDELSFFIAPPPRKAMVIQVR